MSNMKLPVRVTRTEDLYKIETNTGALCVYRVNGTPVNADTVRREGNHVATQCVGKPWLIFFDGEWLEKISAVDKRTLDALEVFGHVGGQPA